MGTNFKNRVILETLQVFFFIVIDACSSHSGQGGRTCKNSCGRNCAKCHSLCDTHYNLLRPHGVDCSFDVDITRVNSLHVSCGSDLWEPYTKYVGMVFWGHGGKPNRNSYRMGTRHVLPGYVFIVKSESILEYSSTYGVVHGKAIDSQIDG